MRSKLGVQRIRVGAYGGRTPCIAAPRPLKTLLPQVILEASVALFAEATQLGALDSDFTLHIMGSIFLGQKVGRDDLRWEFKLRS